MSMPYTASAPKFVRPSGQAELDSGKLAKISTRVPAGPNGYLHIGHAKSICLNFGLAKEFGGECNLRFDDTNPAKEDQEYIDAIKSDIQWLGFQRSEEHTSELQSLMRISYAVFCLRKKIHTRQHTHDDSISLNAVSVMISTHHK